MVLVMQDKWVFIFHKKQFQQSELFQHWQMTELRKFNNILMYGKKIIKKKF